MSHGVAGRGSMVLWRATWRNPGPQTSALAAAARCSMNVIWPRASITMCATCDVADGASPTDTGVKWP